MFTKKTRHTEPDPVRLQIVADDPDTVMVVAEEDPMPEAIQVIPTRRAQAYWTHPSQDHDETV